MHGIKGKAVATTGRALDDLEERSVRSIAARAREQAEFLQLRPRLLLQRTQATLAGVYNSYFVARAMAAPLNLWAGAVQALWSRPSFPLADTPYGRAVVAGSSLLERATRSYHKPPFTLETTSIDGRPVAVREAVVQRTPFCNLLHFERDAARSDPKLLVLAPLSGHHASLLRDTVERLLPEHDLYITDWTDARLVPLSAGRFDLDDYIELVQRFLRALGDGVHVLAVCQPGVPALAAISLMAEAGDPATPRSMTLMAAPIDTRVNPTEVDRVATTRPLEWFELAAVHRVPFGEPGFLRRVYPGFLQLGGFISLNTSRHVDAHWNLYLDLLKGDEESAAHKRRFYDDYLAVMDVPAEYYLQTIASVFQKHELARGEMRWRGTHPIRPACIRDTALLTIEGENDDITSVGQTSAAHALCSSIPAVRRQSWVQPGAASSAAAAGARRSPHGSPPLSAVQHRAQPAVPL